MQRVINLGGEGLMLWKMDEPYYFYWHFCCLKVKKFNDAEAEVIEHVQGRNRLKGKMGALLCKSKEGAVFKVGSGFTDKERKNPPPIGSIITFSYFELTKNGIPWFPTFLRVHETV